MKDGRHRIALLFSLLSIGACADAGDAGERCIADADCESGLECYENVDTGSRRCLAPCDPAETILCTSAIHESGGTCVAIPDGGSPGVCLLGGTVDRGEPCRITSECIPEHLCVLMGVEGVCRPACQPSDPIACGGEEVCRELDGSDGGVRGYCILP